jgi:Family of unknown function (DUF6519)/Carboxypeptidase regulatory-like domain
MGGDYTRWTFNPIKDYAEVLKQQGRVDLDADWNELAEIINRRWRAETMDIIGRAVVPENTPNAFFITPTGPGQFNIGIGRMYVDGLLAECHGVPPLQYDASLGEMEGSNPVPFNQQPYYPDPSPLPSTASATDLVYLDVWQREVTAVQDPDIREKALGGPDTATRLQTVWQVKVLPNVGQHACGDTIQGWDTVTAPSAGRLTTSTVVPSPSPDPCILSPTGGYRGLENRLYRVEVHTAGTVGGAVPATFKWSRDNGSVVSSVTALSAPGGPSTTITVASLGRDRVLRFQAGDWVEILDDASELDGRAGVLTKVIAPPDEANRTITVSPSIPAGLFDPTDPSRHTRVRRWDQSNTGPGSDVDATTGLINVAAGPLDIEDGIQVSFSDDGSGGLLHVGDYWIFAARTADGSVEVLQAAPPRGILHHFARLGFITWDANGSGNFSSCIVHWPPPMGDGCTGCCTVTVGDGIDSQGTFTDIQQAIDALGTAGGEVCLGRGVFLVTDTIRINATKKNVTIRGMGWATRIIFSPDAQSGSRILFDIESTSHVRLQSFFAAAVAADAIVRIANSRFCQVFDTTLVNLNFDVGDATAFVGTLQAGRAIELGGSCADCDFENNMLLAAKGIVSAGETTQTQNGAVQGTVMDVTGAVVPQVTVTLTNQATGTQQTTTTDTQGRFAFSNVPPGNYTVSASASGFSSAQQNVTVPAGQTVQVTLTLQFNLNRTVEVARTGTVGAPRDTAPATVNLEATQTQISFVARINVRHNRIFALQVSVFFEICEDCNIQDNRLLGISQSSQKRLQEIQNLNRESINNFQNILLSVATDNAASFAFQGAGVILLLALRVTVSDNLITALAGFVSLFVLDAQIENNQVLALIGCLVLNGLILRVARNFMAGLLVGFVQGGLLADFESASNLWLGLTGISFLTSTQIQAALASVVSAGLTQAGFAKSGNIAVANFNSKYATVGVDTRSFGMVELAKIHDDVFLTFETAIMANNVMSGDIRIYGNSFDVCSQSAIAWKALAIDFPGFTQAHVFENNSFSITGVGIVCACTTATIRDNIISCPGTALRLSCRDCSVLDNDIAAPKVPTAAPVENGQIEVLGPEQFQGQSTCRIIGNCLNNSPGRGIRMVSSLYDVTIARNHIEATAGIAILTEDGVNVDRIDVPGNHITGCGIVAQKPVADGTIMLPAIVTDGALSANRLINNAGFGIYLGVIVGQGGQGPTLRIQDNLITGQTGELSQYLVFGVGGPVHFTGNQCLQPVTTDLKLFSRVMLYGQWLLANANTVVTGEGDTPNLLLRAFPGLPSSVVVTSNIVNGISTSGFVHIQNANNILNV